MAERRTVLKALVGGLAVGGLGGGLTGGVAGYEFRGTVDGLKKKAEALLHTDLPDLDPTAAHAAQLDVAELERDRDEKASEAAGLRAANKTISDAYEDLEDDKKTSDDALKDATKANGTLTTERDTARTALQTCQTDKGKLEKQVTDADKSAGEKKVLYDANQKAAQEKLEAIVKERDAARDEAKAAKATSDGFRDKFIASERDLRQANIDYGELQRIHEHDVTALEEQGKQLTAKDGEITGLKGQLEAKDGEITGLKGQLAAKDNEIRELTYKAGVAEGRLAEISKLYELLNNPNTPQEKKSEALFQIGSIIMRVSSTG